MPKKILPVVANATTGSCSPQNKFEDIGNDTKDKPYFKK